MWDAGCGVWAVGGGRRQRQRADDSAPASCAYLVREELEQEEEDAHHDRHVHQRLDQVGHDQRDVGHAVPHVVLRRQVESVMGEYVCVVVRIEGKEC